MNRYLKKASNLIKPQKQLVAKTYNSYGEALLDCGGPGYHDDTLAEIVLKKTQAYIEQLKRAEFVNADALTSSYLISLLIQGKKQITIIDFGGACGLQYFTCKKILGNKVGLNWNVVETEPMSRAAQVLSENGLRFFSNLEKCMDSIGPVDLIISASTIPYLPEPAEYLLNITKINARFIFLTRLSFSQTDKDIITVQQSMLSENGRGKLPSGYLDKIVKYPHTNMRESVFNEIMSTHYSLLLKFDENSGIKKVNSEPIVGYGVLFEKR